MTRVPHPCGLPHRFNPQTGLCRHEAQGPRGRKRARINQIARTGGCIGRRLACGQDHQTGAGANVGQRRKSRLARQNRNLDPRQGERPHTLGPFEPRPQRCVLRQGQIAVVLQEPILLPTTIAENIAYGRPKASREEIESAARSANADVFIRRLPQGYETQVGDGAARLSVGERQRLNLARAFLKDAPILLLDEPTSALDAESEELVVRSFHELMKGRTVLMVAHRLSTIRRVDKILVLNDGRLAECGNHDELIRQDGYYARVTRGQIALD